MEFKICGLSMRVEVVLLCIVIGIFIGVNMLCSCSGGVNEGFGGMADGVASTINNVTKNAKKLLNDRDNNNEDDDEDED